MYDFLWRVHQKVPSRGEMVIFYRSYYEDMLVTRVHKWSCVTGLSQLFDTLSG